MPRNQRTQLTPEEQLAMQLSALNDSVTLINNIIASEASDEDSLDCVYRNYRHLEIMLAKEEVVNSGTDFTAVNAAIAAGTAYVLEKDPEFFATPAQ